MSKLTDMIVVGSIIMFVISLTSYLYDIINAISYFAVTIISCIIILTCRKFKHHDAVHAKSETKHDALKNK